MENASKALIMAGGILIGILVLTLAVYLFVSFGSQASKVHKQVHDTQIDQFNSKYNVYLANDKITIYDIVSVAKSAYEYNETTDNTKIQVKLDPNGNNISGVPSYSDLSVKAWQDKFELLLEHDRNGMEPVKQTRDNKVSTGTNAEKDKFSNIISKIGYLPRYECVSKSGQSAIEYDQDTGRIKTIRFYYVGA